MRRNVYTCDICGKDVEEGEISRIVVGTDSTKIRMTKNQRTFDYCRDCLTAKGFIIEEFDESKAKEQHSQNNKTFEEKFIDLLADAGVQFCE